MVVPQPVHRKPTTAARFEGGNVSANQIIEWVISNGDTAVHRPKEDHGSYGRSEIVLITTSTGAKIDVAVGAWVVHDYGGYLLYTAESFFQIYQGDQLISPEKDHWANALKIFEDGTITVEAAQIAAGIWGVQEYERVASSVEAIQFPTQQKNEAAKDYEERIRKVAAFIVNNGGEVTDQGKDFLGIDFNRAGENTLRPTTWVVLDSFGDLKRLSDDDFNEQYKAVS